MVIFHQKTHIESQNISQNRSQDLKPFQTFKIVTRKFCKKFSFTSFDRSRIPFDWSNALFIRSNRNRASIEIGKDSMIDFLTISIDWAKVLTNWKYWISNFYLENSRTWIFTLSTLWNNIFQIKISLLQPIHVYIYIYSMIYCEIVVDMTFLILIT